MFKKIAKQRKHDVDKRKRDEKNKFKNSEFDVSKFFCHQRFINHSRIYEIFF